LAQENIQQKDATITSLQNRLGGCPQAEQREWCGGPCRGTQPLTNKEREEREARSQRKRRKEQRARKAEQGTRPDGDWTARESVVSQVSQRSDGSDLERQLDKDIHDCQGEPEDLGELDPDVAAWNTSNSIAAGCKSRFVVPSLPSPTNDDEEDGAMALLDREIRSALLLEDAESGGKLDLMHALQAEAGYGSDSSG